MTRIGVGGLINMDKLKQTHHVLNDIALFHYHAKQQIETVNSRSEEIEFSPLNTFCFFRSTSDRVIILALLFQIFPRKYN